MTFWARDLAAPDTSDQLLWVLLHVQAKFTWEKIGFYGFCLFSRKKKKITFRMQLNRVFDVVLMYRINKLCSDVGIYLLQHDAW